MVNSYRFLDSDMFFDDVALTILLRILEKNPVEERIKWFMEIRSCRRRRQIGFNSLYPVNTIFTTKHEFQFMQYKSEVARIQFELQEKGMLVFDAFRAFNSSNSGLMTCSELYGGMEFLHIPFTPDQIYELIRKLSIDAEGLVSYQEWKRVFQLSEDELESRGLSNISGGSFEPVPPKKIPELAEILRQTGKEEVKITDSLLLNMKVKINPVGDKNFESIWNSAETNSKKQMSIWAPKMVTGFLHNNKTRLCIGHYALPGLAEPSTKSGFGLGGNRYLLIEVTDNNKSRVSKSKAIDTLLALCFPAPLRFRLVWHFQRGAKSFWAWRPQPPDGFIALGMIFTTSGMYVCTLESVYDM